MQLSSLIDEYKACEKELYTAIKSEKVSAIREFDIRMNWLRNVIRDFSAPSAEEKLRQIRFFLDSISQASDIDPRSTLFADVRSVVERYLDEQPEDADAMNRIARNGADLIRDPHGYSDLIGAIESTGLRVAAFDTEFRYTYSSPANGRFHALPQQAFRGRHVAEMIGTDRFEKRAKAYFDKCLGGEDQCYYYFLETDRHGRQLVECRMLRQSDNDNSALGALLVLRDVTRDVDDPLRSAEENRI